MILSIHEAVVWWEFQHGMGTSEIASRYEHGRRAPDYVSQLYCDRQGRVAAGLENVQLKSTQYVSKVLNRARRKIERELREHARSHRLDIDSVQDYKGILIGFDYQANSQVFIVFTMRIGLVLWYRHSSYAGRLCDGTPYGNTSAERSEPCPKTRDCREALDTVLEEYGLTLRRDEERLYMTEQAVTIFNRLAAKEVPRYKREE